MRILKKRERSLPKMSEKAIDSRFSPRRETFFPPITPISLWKMSMLKRKSISLSIKDTKNKFQSNSLS